MTRIDFYLDADDKLGVAARIVQKAYGSRNRVIVLAPDRGLADSLDRRLWMQPPLAFLPHCRIGDALAGETPVLLAESQDQLANAPHHDLLINLSPEAPAGFGQFQRLIEIVGLDEGDKAPARERFRQYRNAGYDIQSHRLGEAA